jgi:hypothetical protein
LRVLTDAVIEGAKAGAVTGLVGGVLPFVAGLFAREYKKGMIGLAACVLLGSLFGGYAVIPMSLGSLVTILRARNERDEALGGDGLVFKYGPVFAVLALVGLPFIGLMALSRLGLAVFTIASSKSGLSLKLSSVFIGLLGVAFGCLVLLGIRQWYVPLSEYTLTDEGVTTKFRSSSVFHPWNALISARHRTAMKQVELEFEGSARRVVLGNVDLDPQQAKVLRALALIESVTGRSVTRTRF